MHADWTVELGSDDPVLELPWSDPDGRVRYFDLKRRPELLLEVPEAFENRALGEFLGAVNSPVSMLESAKCDMWLTDELNEEEQIFGAAWKFVSYVDLLFTSRPQQQDFEQHESFAGDVCALLDRAPEVSAAAEFIVRRCVFHQESREGFYFTFYLSGYGDDEEDARKRWTIGMSLVQNAILQLSAAGRV